MRALLRTKPLVKQTTQSPLSSSKKGPSPVSWNHGNNGVLAPWRGVCVAVGGKILGLNCNRYRRSLATLTVTLLIFQFSSLPTPLDGMVESFRANTSNCCGLPDVSWARRFWTRINSGPRLLFDRAIITILGYMVINILLSILNVRAPILCGGATNYCIHILIVISS